MKLKNTLNFIALCVASSAFCADPFVGEYSGSISNIKFYPYGNDKQMSAQISKYPDGYKLRIMPEFNKRSNDELLIDGLKAIDNEIILDNVGNWKFTGTVTPNEINLDITCGKHSGKITMLKTHRVSPTLGLKAPEKAKVLFDGKNTDSWLNTKGNPCVWKIVDGESMRVTRLEGEDKKINQTLKSKDAFGDFKLHLEFKTPDMSNQTGQARANSGVFIGPYEIQVLDSFGNEGIWNDCGSIYRISPPIVNASLPPETWQTYDIEFTAAEFDGDKLVSLPRISVWLNGVKVQSGMEIPHGTSLKQLDRRAYKHPRPPYKIELQDHNDPVEYRNIWIEEK